MHLLVKGFENKLVLKENWKKFTIQNDQQEEYGTKDTDIK